MSDDVLERIFNRFSTIDKVLYVKFYDFKKRIESIEERLEALERFVFIDGDSNEI